MRERDEFLPLLTKLEGFLNKKLSDQQAEIFYQKCKNIPYRAMGDIIDRLIDDLSPGSKFPEPKIFAIAWQEWQQNNPAKIIRTKIDCKYCDSRGYLDVEQIPGEVRGKFEDKEIDWFWNNPKTIYRAVVNCGHCHARPFAPKIVPEYTIEQITGMDWVRVCG